MAATRQRVDHADTRMMGIVHDALRRDLRRTREALSRQPYPRGSQKAAIAGHVEWMMRYLQQHHEGEDHDLWPLLRRKAPGAAPLLDTMETDHAGIAEAMAMVTAAAANYAGGEPDEPRLALLAALDELDEVLLPHLEREEQETMPVAEAAMTAAEWQAWSQQFIRHKSFAELGEEGHWLLDGLDDFRYQVVVRQVPPVPRFILVHGFARRYRRHAAARWDTPGMSPGDGNSGTPASGTFSEMKSARR